MTDEIYFNKYQKLAGIIENEKRFDTETFIDIFDGKIKPMIHNTYNAVNPVIPGFGKEDFCQLVFMKLWQKSVVKYFLNEAYDKSPVGYLRWCKAVINNYLKSLAEKKSNGETAELSGLESVPAASPGDDFINRETVKIVYNLVVQMNVKYPMKLTWLAVYTLLFIGEGETKIKCNHILLEKYSHMTLSEITEEIISLLSGSSPYLLDGTAANKLKREAEEWSNITLRECIGDEAALKTVSDWIYKINQKLKKSVEWN